MLGWIKIMKKSEEFNLETDLGNTYVFLVDISTMKSFETLMDDWNQEQSLKKYLMIGFVQYVELQKRTLSYLIVMQILWTRKPMK